MSKAGLTKFLKLGERTIFRSLNEAEEAGLIERGDIHTRIGTLDPFPANQILMHSTLLSIISCWLMHRRANHSGQLIWEQIHSNRISADAVSLNSISIRHKQNPFRANHERGVMLVAWLVC